MSKCVNYFNKIFKLRADNDIIENHKKLDDIEKRLKRLK